jgi:hypothetical protein
MTFPKSDPLGLRQNDRGLRWRDNAQKFEEECAAERRRREREDQQRRADAIAAHEAGLLRDAHEARIAALEKQLADLEANFLEVGVSLLHAIERVSDERVDLARDQREELRGLQGEVAKLTSMLDELRRGTDFKFARESSKGEVTGMPSFLRHKTTIN